MKIITLGIESSCDDTAVAIVDSDRNILANIVINQNSKHEEFKGVVPEIASRAHLENIEIALNQALSQSGLELKDIDVIAGTSGPGLIGGVIVGCMYSKALASTLNIPFIAINHLEGHALTARLTDNIDYPYLLFLASGGHCQFISVNELGKYDIIGETIDDAIGEAYDKVAKMLDLGFPGGPEIEKLAKNGDPHRFTFPMPLYNKNAANMSFSGMKTAVRKVILELTELNYKDKCDISASFQFAVCKIIRHKLLTAMISYEKEAKNKILVISGGVGANLALREMMMNLAHEKEYQFVAPPINLCTDNAAMIAFAGQERFENGIINKLDFCPRARWRINEL